MADKAGSSNKTDHIEGERPFNASKSKSMGQLRIQASSSTSAFQEPAQQQPQQVVYASLDDFSSRVEIYKGRHSIVWNCVCRHTHSPIILKGYVKAKMTERNFYQVRREIRLMSIINYDGAVTLLGNFEDKTTIYIVQEICAKGDLFKKLLRSGGSLEERFVAGEVILPLLLTLEYLHARGIYHRDIKPENIFFTKEGQFKLGDFGLAIDATLERSKSRVGTLDYMSPEVVSLPTADERKKMEAAGRTVMEQPYGEKCDVWAAGVLAYELLVGRPPFEVEDESETRKKIMFETTVKFPPHVSTEAMNFIKAVLAKNASLRPSASDLLHHAWLRPYLMAMAHRVAHLDPAALSAFRATPSLVASSSTALVAAAAKAAAAAGAATGAAFPAGGIGSNSNSTLFAAAMAGAGSNGQVGRSASFSSLTRTPGHGGSLCVSVDSTGQHAAAVAAMATAGSGSISSLPSGALPAHHLQNLAHHFNQFASGGSNSSGIASPAMPTTPGPYGPPGMSRRPIWETDQSPSSFTAVRTAGMSGEVPSSPTSPRVKPAGGIFGALSSSSNSPLLKAALNANLARINAQQHVSASGGYSSSSSMGPGSLTGASMSASGALGGAGSIGNAGQAGISSNVKQRLKEYFVARNPEVALKTPPTAMLDGSEAGMIAAGYSSHQQHLQSQMLQQQPAQQ